MKNIIKIRDRFKNKFWRAGLSAVFGLLTLTAVVKAAPANDNFLSAQVLSGVEGTFVSTNVGATKEPGEPNHAGNRGGTSIWFKFVAPGNGVLQFATNNTSFDTVVGVYSGASLSQLSFVAQNDNDEVSGWSQIYSRVFVGTQTGQTYYIAVDGKNPLDGSGAPAGIVAGSFSFENVALNDNFESATQLVSGNGTYSITSSNVGASRQSGEPELQNNAGGRSIWFNYYNDANYPRSISLNITSSRASDARENVTTVFGIFTGNTLATLTPIFQTHYTGVGKIRLTFLAAPNSTYHIALDGYNGGAGASSGTFTITYGITKDPRMADFDEDGKADLAVFRPTEGNWYMRDSGTNNLRALHWGANGDKPLLGRDEEGKAFLTAFRPDTGIFHQLFDYFYYTPIDWGMSGDVALVKHSRNDFGTTDAHPAVFRPSTGTWWFYYNGYDAFQFGQPGDVPVLADFDGDGTDEITLFRPSNGNWNFFNVATQQYQTVNFGLSGDIPVPADYDADGIADIAIFRPSTGDWWFLNRQTGAQTPVHFGQFGDKPQPADYDGDGKADICVFRAGVWWIWQTSNGVVKTVKWGLSNDVPVSSPLTVN